MNHDEKRYVWSKQRLPDVLYQHELKIEELEKLKGEIMEEITYKDLVNRHIKLMDENIVLMNKQMDLQNKNFKLVFMIKQIEDKLIDSFNGTLTVRKEDNPVLWEHYVHYRNGLNVALDIIKNTVVDYDSTKEKDNGTI